MKISHDGQQVRLTYNQDTGSMALYDEDGEMIDRIDVTMVGEPFVPNTVWVEEFNVAPLVGQGIGTRTGLVQEMADGVIAYQIDIVHADLNDGGYSCFGDFARRSLGEQCQYASRYIDGRMDGYEALGKDLRFLNVGTGDYHAIRIHRDDMPEFEKRYREMAGKRRTQ